MLLLRRERRCSLVTKKTRCCRRRRKSGTKRRKACLRSACISHSHSGICHQTLLHKAEARWVMRITVRKFSDFNKEYLISHLIPHHDRSQKRTSPHEWPAQWCRIKRYHLKLSNFCITAITKWNDRNNDCFQTCFPKHTPICLYSTNR